MIGFDLAIVLMLALGLRGGRREVLGALAVYTLGVVAVSGIVLDDSDIDPAPLALGRFDLAPAALALAAVLARDALRSATWGALLAAGVAVKAFPLALLPALARGERDPVRVAVAAAVPLAAAIALVIVWADDFGSALSYHGERGLQIESLAATPLEIGAIDDPSRAAEYGSGASTTSARRRSRPRDHDRPARLRLRAGRLGRLAEPRAPGAGGDRPAGNHRRAGARPLAAVPLLVVAPLGGGLRARGRERPARRRHGHDPARAPVLRTGPGRLRRRVRLAAGGAQRAAARLPGAALRPDPASGARAAPERPATPGRDD